jgi:hypothetical protein
MLTSRTSHSDQEDDVTPKPRALLFFLLALGIAACANVPVSDPAAQARAMTFEAKPGKALLYVIRPKQLNAGGVLMLATLDDRVLGALATRSYFVVDVEPGTHQLVATFDGTTAREELFFRVEEGDVHFTRIATRGTMPVAQEIGSASGQRLVSEYAAIATARRTTEAEVVVTDTLEPEPVGEMGRLYVINARTDGKGEPTGLHGPLLPGAMHSNVRGIGVLIDDRFLGLLPVGTFVGMDLEPGSHRVLGTLNMMNTFAPYDLEIGAGETRYLTVDVGFASADIEELPPAIARRLVAGEDL